MKSNILKRSLSLMLALIMLVSMCTVAIVNTVAAETDTAVTGANITGGTTLYLKPNANWKADGARFAAYFCNGTSAAKWYSAYGPNADGCYWVTVSAGETHKNIIWCRMNPATTTNNWDNKWDQTNDLTYPGSTTPLYTVAEGAWSNGSGSWSTYTPPSEPGAPADPNDKITISFLIASGNDWIANDDAKMFINDGAEITQMTETVDTIGGHVMWTAKVAVNDSYTFNRTSYFFDEDNALEKPWNKWYATSRGTNTVYKADGSGTGSWQAESTVSPAATDDIENFWDDLWIAPADKNDVNHAVKVWYNKADGKFNLFVPSYFDLSNVKVYTDATNVTIGNTTYSSGDTASLTAGTGITFKRGTTTGTINIYQTQSTAAMMMTTKEELYTGTVCDTGRNGGLSVEVAWPEGSDITAENYNSVYKDAIETKGSYYFYDEEGAQVNKDTVLKKIKGRGNSSFEASMKIYGKYAYNFNLDEKVELIEGSTASKKWSMLANNVDHTMMRNTFIYQLADELELACAPETRLVDVYDNGKYLGAFIITEKVEYGKNTLMAIDSQGNKINNLDDGNEEANIDAYGYYDGNEDGVIDEIDEEEEYFVFDFDNLVYDTDTYTTEDGQSYPYQYTKSDVNGNVFVSPEGYNTDYNYLLEHELSSRYTAEASWFVTPKGQPVVVKYPEFATQEEMQWIISEYAAMEQAVYNDDYATYSSLIDVDSFAKMYLIQELTLNLDSCATSYYIHNEFRDGKSVLVAGPVWDYDWSMGAYAGDTKWVYNVTTNTVSASSEMSYPEQMFVKNKAIQTDGTASNGVTWATDYNLQAKMANNQSFWTVCQSIYTNDMVPLLYDYVIDDYSDTNDGGILVDELMPKFKSSMDMNNARWGVYNFTDDKSTGDDWGTKVTSDYSKGTGIANTSNFKYTSTASSGNATKCYENTVYYLNDWLSTRKDYLSSSTGGNLYNKDLEFTYKFEDVSFNYDQSADESTLSLKPIATVTYGSSATTFEPVADEELMYTVYLNGEPYETYKFTEEATIKLEENSRTEVYIEVFPTADHEKTGESESVSFTYGKVPVEVTIYFKSSASYRYAPKLTVNGGAEIVMEKGETAFNHNPSRTQNYYWYSCKVELDSVNASTLQFSNAYSMRATVSLSDVVEGGEYYFGCDNMNNGNTAVNLTDASETVRNFVKSATHMVYNEATDAGVATTSIDGTVYKLGDTDSDNTLSILDATTIQMALVEKTDLNETQTALADYDLDEVTSIVDATMIQTYLVNN